jgi:hypothetical protein
MFLCSGILYAFFDVYTLAPVIRDSAVGIATSYCLDDRGIGFRVPVVSKIFTSSCRANRLWGSPNFQSPGVKRPGPDADTHLRLMPRSRKLGSVHPLRYTPLWRSAYLSTGTTLLYLTHWLLLRASWNEIVQLQTFLHKNSYLAYTTVNTTVIGKRKVCKMIT